MTRRVAKNMPEKPDADWYFDAYNNGPFWNWWHPNGKMSLPQIRNKYGQPDDLLWVRETWRFKEIETGEDFVEYSAGGDMEFPNVDNLKWSGDPFDGKWRPSIHMSKWMSRIWLKVTGIKVERLQDISEEDAEKEGIDFLRHYPDVDETLTAKELFMCLWDSINGTPRKDGKDISWESNPWVWAPEFEITNNPHME